MTTTEFRPTRAPRGSAALLAVALTIALAGCTGVGPAETPQPSRAAGPISLVGVECADLVSLDDVRGILNESVEPTENLFYPGGSWPVATVGLQQAGGLTCEWSDSANQAGAYEALLEIDVLPNAEDEWSEWFSSMSGFYPNSNDDGTVLSQCSSSLGGSYFYCKYALFAGGSWATISVSNIAQDADTTVIADAVASALTAATPPAAEWSPAPLAGLPATCGELLPLDTVRTTLGVADMDERDAPLLMPHLHNAGLDDALNCSWSNPYTSAVGSPLQVVVLPGGGWAWDAAWAVDRPDHSPAQPVEGLGDAAFAGCQTIDNPTCFLDVLVGGAWVSLDGKGAVNEETLAQLAASVVATIGG